MTVYFPQPPQTNRSRPALDLTPAAKYGEIAFVFEDAMQPSLDPASAFETARERLKDFDFEDDCLSIAGGDPFGSIVCSMVLAQMAEAQGQGKFTYLRFDRGYRGAEAHYIPVRVSI